MTKQRINQVVGSRTKPRDSKERLYIRTFLENVATFLWRIKKALEP